MDHLLEQLARSLDDHALSPTEKQGLRSLLAERPLRPDQLRQVRNRAFDLVMDKVRGPVDAAAMPALVKWLSDIVRLLDQSMQVEPVETEVWFSPGEDCRDAVIGRADDTPRR